MKRKYIYVIVAAAVILTAAAVFANGGAKEAEAVKSLFAGAEKLESFNIKKAGDAAFVEEHLQQVSKAYKVYDKNGNRLGTGFVTTGRGYNGSISVAVGIDSSSNRITGIKIIKHMETPEYGGHIEENWFIERFAGRSSASFLNLVTLDENSPQDIIQVTGATLSSRAVVDAVNAAISAYCMVELGQINAKPVINVEAEKKKEEETFYIKHGDKSIQITMKDLKEFPTVKVDCTLSKSTGTKIDMTAEGPLLQEVLKKYGIDLFEYEGIGITGRDGYYAMVSKEIIDNSRVILGYIFNGKPIPEEEKPIRVVIPEEFGVYWVKMVSDIELYDDIPEKQIKSVKMFYALTQDIEPYGFEYYGSKDASIEVGKILAKFKNVNPKGFFTMASSDGLVKNESIAMVNNRYYIKIEGAGAPMNVSPNFKLGYNVKNIAYFSTTEDAVIFPNEMQKLTGTVKLGNEEGLPLEKVLEIAGIEGVAKKQFEAVDTLGESIKLSGEEISRCILVYKDKEVTLVCQDENGVKRLSNLLEINEAAE